MKIFIHKHCADSLLSKVARSTIAFVTEAVKKIINNDIVPDEEETLVVLSPVNQAHPSVGHLFAMYTCIEDVVEVHCYIVDIRRTDRKQIRSKFCIIICS